MAAQNRQVERSSARAIPVGQVWAVRVRAGSRTRPLSPAPAPCWGKKLKLATFAQEGPPLPTGNPCFPLPLKGQQPPPHQIPVKIPGPAPTGLTSPPHWPLAAAAESPGPCDPSTQPAAGAPRPVGCWAPVSQLPEPPQSPDPTTAVPAPPLPLSGPAPQALRPQSPSGNNMNQAWLLEAQAGPSPVLRLGVLFMLSWPSHRPFHETPSAGAEMGDLSRKVGSWNCSWGGGERGRAGKWGPLGARRTASSPHCLPSNLGGGPACHSLCPSSLQPLPTARASDLSSLPGDKGQAGRNLPVDYSSSKSTAFDVPRFAPQEAPTCLSLDPSLWPCPPAPLLSLLAKTGPSGLGASSWQKPEKQGCQLCVPCLHRMTWEDAESSRAR